MHPPVPRYGLQVLSFTPPLTGQILVFTWDNQVLCRAIAACCRHLVHSIVVLSLHDADDLIRADLISLHVLGTRFSS
jgi:hypothetical protein